MSEKTFHRSTDEKIIAGVCGGIAEYFGLNPWLIRILYIVLTLVTAIGLGVLIYILLWIFVKP